jgi:hypothetical protein
MLILACVLYAVEVCRLYAWSGQIPQGSGYIWLDNVNCNGDELSLDACYHNPVGNNDCGHSEDFGVQCSRFIYCS